jgi:cytochrome c oxidase accessory protein FixG
VTVVIDRTRPPDKGGQPVSAAEALRQKKDAGGGLYKPRVPIYPKLVHGTWRRIKWAVMFVTLGVYYVTPWIRWPRPSGLPQQAVLVDFEGGRFYFFWLQLWPQEVYFITGLLVIAALCLFLASALFGRLWCGYTCPQTVWTDLYIYVERMFEGDRNARMKLDASPWSLDKAWRKLGKHAVWLGIAFGTGGAWIFYFHDAPSLLVDFWTGKAPIASYLSCGLLTATTYLLAGTMREQVCTYMCPWPRIQGAMIDHHSLEVTYRYDRGEPRGPHKKGQVWEGRGDCIDCNACVTACPMGIDIRNGAQLECINCGLCIDACDEIMDRVGRPRGLIAYDTDSAVHARSQGLKPRYKLVRPRTLYYAAGLAIVGGLMVWGLAARTRLDVHAIRDRNPLFVRMQNGEVRNGYTLKIANKGFYPATVRVSLEGVPGATLKIPGQAQTAGPLSFTVAANQDEEFRLFAFARPGEGALIQPAQFVVKGARETDDAKTTFIYGDGR